MKVKKKYKSMRKGKSNQRIMAGLMNALKDERYEDCANLIDLACQCGAASWEIEDILADYGCHRN